METFTLGQQLTARSTCDHDCIFKTTVLKVTAKTVTVKIQGNVKRCKIHSDDNGLYINALGIYSMSPRFRATK